MRYAFRWFLFAETTVENRIIGASLEIGSTLTINYYAELSEINDNAEMRFIRGNTSETVKGVRVSGTRYEFKYKGINPQCMNDNITAELMLNGEVVETMEKYSVKDYCDRQNAKSAAELGFTKYTQYQAFRTLLADMLSYGSAAQSYQNYNTSDLVDNLPWVAEQKSIFSVPEGVREVNGNTDENCRVTGVGVRVSNVIQIYFKFKLTENATVTLNEKVVDVEGLNKNGDIYTVYSKVRKKTLNEYVVIGWQDIQLFL